jgi:hypothetical protein
MDYISQPTGCWFEETSTGRVTWIQKGISPSVTWDRCSPIPTYDAIFNRMDTPQGHRYELWESCDLYPERTWTSDLFRLFVDHDVSVTLFVDPEIASVYILVPTCMGSTIKISPESHPEVDSLRARICISVVDGGMISPVHVEELFLGLASVHSTGKLSDIALVALGSFTDHSPADADAEAAAEADGVNVSPTESESE